MFRLYGTSTQLWLHCEHIIRNILLLALAFVKQPQHSLGEYTVIWIVGCVNDSLAYCPSDPVRAAFLLCQLVMCIAVLVCCKGV